MCIQHGDNYERCIDAYQQRPHCLSHAQGSLEDGIPQAMDTRYGKLSIIRENVGGAITIADHGCDSRLEQVDRIQDK